MTQAPTPGPLSASDIAHVRDYWSAICDSDWHLIPADIRDDLEERLAAVGLAEWRAVTDADLEDTFAYERGIEKGRSCLDLTALGHLAFKSDADGWMPWSGGENPVPGQRVQWQTRNEADRADCEVIIPSEALDWAHPPRQKGCPPIIAFRLAPTAPVEASGSEREHGPKCWGKTSASDEMAHCYCGSEDSPQLREAVLKGVGKINGDGWKDTTTEGEVVFVWNAEKPTPYAPGQYPRVGNEGWSASTSQYDFTPATANDVPAILALLSARPLALGGQQGEFNVEEYVADYEFRADGEGGCYTPTENERALLIDAIHGALSEASLSLAPTAPVEASGSEREAVAQALGNQRGHPDPWPTDFYDADAALKALRSIRPQPSGETREAVLSETEAKVLLAMDGDWDDDFGFRHTCDIADNAEVASDLCKAVLTVLRLRGLVDLRKGLLTEEGRAFGSGWQITNEGHEAVKALLSARPLALGGQKGGGEAEAAWLEAEAQLSEISAAIGSVRFMDPPDGGSVTLAEQVRRMRLALEEAEAALSTTPARAEAQDEGAEMTRLLKLADAALANVTAFEDDARYIMGNTNYAITENARSEIRMFLLAQRTRTSVRPEALERSLSILDRLLDHSGARGSFDAMKHGDAVKDAEELLRSARSPGHTDLMVTPESIDTYMEAQDEGAAGDSAIALARRCTQTIAAQHGPDSDFANGARMVLAALICAPSAHPSPSPAADEDRVRSALTDLVSWFDKPVQGERGMVWVIRAGDQGADDAVAEALAALKSTAAKEGGE